MHRKLHMICAWYLGMLSYIWILHTATWLDTCSWLLRFWMAEHARLYTLLYYSKTDRYTIMIVAIFSLKKCYYSYYRTKRFFNLITWHLWQVTSLKSESELLFLFKTTTYQTNCKRWILHNNLDEITSLAEWGTESIDDIQRTMTSNISSKIELDCTRLNREDASVINFWPFATDMIAVRFVTTCDLCDM